jgi:hypothetical protein
MLRAALEFVALIVKILSCNKNFFFMVYDGNYFNCSTLVVIKIVAEIKMVSTCNLV